jgi:pullulanase/glycogen debranching enzyme
MIKCFLRLIPVVKNYEKKSLNSGDQNTWDKFCFISPSGGYFKVFNQSEGMVAILDVVQSHRTQFWEKLI